MHLLLHLVGRVLGKDFPVDWAVRPEGRRRVCLGEFHLDVIAVRARLAHIVCVKGKDLRTSRTKRGRVSRRRGR